MQAILWGAQAILGVKCIKSTNAVLKQTLDLFLMPALLVYKAAYESTEIQSIVVVAIAVLVIAISWFIALTAGRPPSRGSI